MSQAEKERIRTLYDREAPTYDRAMQLAERILLGGGREWVCTRARGEVLEVAVGTGRNLPYYSSDVHLTGIDLSPTMLGIASRRATELGRDVDLRIGDAEHLEFSDEAFDTVTCTYSLCTIPNDRQAVSEVQRVLRPGGKLLLAEHVRSPVAIVRAIQRVLEPLTLRQAADHLLRDPLEAVQGQELVVEELERRKIGIVEFLSVTKPDH